MINRNLEESARAALKAMMLYNYAEGETKGIFTSEIKDLVEALGAPGCSKHPKAPHGFMRNASHAEDRYVCECESWDPYRAGFEAGYQHGIESVEDLLR